MNAGLLVVWETTDSALERERSNFYTLIATKDIPATNRGYGHPFREPLTFPYRIGRICAKIEAFCAAIWLGESGSINLGPIVINSRTAMPTLFCLTERLASWIGLPAACRWSSDPGSTPEAGKLRRYPISGIRRVTQSRRIGPRMGKFAPSLAEIRDLVGDLRKWWMGANYFWKTLAKLRPSIRLASRLSLQTPIAAKAKLVLTPFTHQL